MMYKLENGKLITPPTVWKGIVGYDRDLQRLTADGWLPLIVSGDGDVVEYIQHADHIEEKHTVPPYDYKELRRQAYPSLGDMIDAICKAYDGEPDELKVLIAQRNAIKATIKKEPDVD